RRARLASSREARPRRASVRGARTERPGRRSREVGIPRRSRDSGCARIEPASAFRHGGGDGSGAGGETCARDARPVSPAHAAQARGWPCTWGGMMAGYSGTPLATKLGIKPGHEVALFRPPPEFEKTVGELPENVHVQVGLASKAPLDVIVAFFTKRVELERQLPSL